MPTGIYKRIKRRKLSEEVKIKIGNALRGRKPSEETKKRMSLSWTPERRKLLSESYKDGKSNSWKGDNVSYSALHTWIRNKLGRPSLCEHCKTTTAKKYEWANKSHQYKRDLSDWIRLCTSCHIKYDRIGKPKRYKKNCHRGHILKKDNTYIRKNGHRVCKICRKITRKIWIKNR